MAEEDDPFPSWNQPAQKADVIRAMVYTRGTLVALHRLIEADSQSAKAEARHDLTAAYKKLDEVFDSIAGRVRE